MRQNQYVPFLLFHHFTYLSSIWRQCCLRAWSYVWGASSCGMGQSIVVLDEGMYVNLILKLHVRKLTRFVWGGCHRYLRVRFRGLQPLNSAFVPLLRAWWYQVLLLRKILQHFGEYFLIYRFDHFIWVAFCKLLGKHVAAGISEALDLLLSLPRVVEADWAFVLIYQCNLLVDPRPILTTVVEKLHVDLLISVIRWFT